jgi:hypothetical protein
MPAAPDRDRGTKRINPVGGEGGLDKRMTPVSTFNVIQFAAVMKSTLNRLPG